MLTHPQVLALRELCILDYREWGARQQGDEGRSVFREKSWREALLKRSGGTGVDLQGEMGVRDFYCLGPHTLTSGGAPEYPNVLRGTSRTS